jgi:hypothetical protein
MPHAYTEDQFVEPSAIALFAELGWTTVFVIQSHRRTRDLLLPRLLSGQVEVSESNVKTGMPAA